MAIDTKKLTVDAHTGKENFEQLSKLFANAMAEDPAFPVLFDKRHMPGLEWLGRFMLRVCLPYDSVFLTNPQAVGLSVWLPPFAEIGLLDLATKGVLSSPFVIGWKQAMNTLKAFYTNEHIREKYAPKNHWYLMMIGMLPEARNQGLGPRLLQPITEKADEEGDYCYLETSNPQNHTFYTRNGFRVVHEQSLEPGFPVWYMLRDPQPKSKKKKKE